MEGKGKRRDVDDGVWKRKMREVGEHNKEPKTNKGRKRDETGGVSSKKKKT